MRRWQLSSSSTTSPSCAFDAAVVRARSLGPTIEREVHTNPNAMQQEFWLRDPDGYLIVLAGPSEWRPRSG